MTTLHPQLFNLLAATPAILRTLAAGSEPRGFDGDWGPLEIAAHLLDVEEIAMMTRIRRITEEDRPLIASIDPSARLKSAAFDLRTAEDMLGEFARRRAEDIEWVRSIPEERLLREGVHDEIGVFSAAQVANYWAVHDLTHLRQAMEATRAGFTPFIGAMVRFYDA